MGFLISVQYDREENLCKTLECNMIRNGLILHQLYLV